MLGNSGRLYPFDMIFSANASVFRVEHDPVLETAYFLSKTRVLRVRKKRSSLKLQARIVLDMRGVDFNPKHKKK